MKTSAQWRDLLQDQPPDCDEAWVRFIDAVQQDALACAPPAMTLRVEVESLRACLLGIIREEHTTVENWLVHAPFMEGVSTEDVDAVLAGLRELEKDGKPC